MVAGTTVAELDSGRWPFLTPCSSNGSLMFAPSKQGKDTYCATTTSCFILIIFAVICFCIRCPRLELASDTEVMTVYSLEGKGLLPSFR
jgi:hypothetical protein